MRYDTFYLKSYGSIPVDISYQEYNWQEKPLFRGHVQDTVEILCVCRGSICSEINGMPVSAVEGELLLFNPFDMHSISVTERDGMTEYYCLIFSLRFFEGTMPPEAAKLLGGIDCGSARFRTKFSADEPTAAVIRDQLPGLRELFEKKNAFAELRMEGILYAILAELLENAYIDDPAQDMVNRNFEFLKKVVRYVELHSPEPLTTASVSEALSYSKSHFCHRVRESFGMSFSEYLCRHRLEYAASLRGNPDLLLVDIAGMAGFSDYAYFSRSFRRYMGVTPKAYFGDRQPPSAHQSAAARFQWTLAEDPVDSGEDVSVTDTAPSDTQDTRSPRARRR